MRRQVPELAIDSPALEVALRDTSDSGLGIEAERPLKVGVIYPFRVRSGDDTREVYGLVRWCRTAGDGRYRAGVTVGKTVGRPVSRLSN